MGRTATFAVLIACLAGTSALRSEEFTDDAKKESDAKLTQIFQAATSWALDNEANEFALPENVAQLIGTTSVEAPTLVCKRLGGKPAELKPEDIEAGKKDWKTMAAKLKGHCDFVFAFKGIKLSNEKQDPKVIVAWEKIGGQTDGIIVVSLAGRSRLVPLDKIKETFEANNKAREANKFPVIEMKNDLPAAPE